MKVLGLVVEYNPFHNGHVYHLEKSKELCGADSVVCVMSGNFIQRGEPALVNKWARARMALMSGADLVIELPSVFAMSSAEYFSHSAVKILESLGIVDYICFGSEHGSINDLDKIAQVLSYEPDEYKRALKQFLDSGISYPAAREKALAEYFSKDKAFSCVVNGIIGSPNNILGIEYLKALRRLDSRIIPLTIKRIVNEYNSKRLSGTISSATAIRSHLKSADQVLTFPGTLADSLPHASLLTLENEFKNGRGPVYPSAFEDIILYALRKMPRAKLSSLIYVSEGLENRIAASAESSGTFDELLDSVSTKRYTKTRVNRMLFSALLDITAEEFKSFNSFGGPQYIRVLGFNQKGRLLLSELKGKASLPVIMKAADYRQSCNPLLKRMFEIEALATDIYVLGYKNPEFKKAGQEFTQNVVIFKDS